MLEPAATRVRDPVSGRSAWLAGVVSNPRMDGDTLAFDVAFKPEHDDATRKTLLQAVVANLRFLGFDGPVDHTEAAAAKPSKPKDPVPGMTGPGMAPHGGPIIKTAIPGVRHIVAVASGKGGVGKSTVATNLAVGLSKLGYSTGLVDADVHGPSIPTMMNVTTRPAGDQDGFLVPPSSYGVKCLSMGMLVDPNEAMIWRGPMVMGILRQFLQQARWGELDVLVVDLPPGTGDAQLSLIQAVPIAGAVVVTTPQEVALADARRGLEMFVRLEVPLLGLVENMAYYELPDGTHDPIFGTDGGKVVAGQYGTQLLAELPLRTSIRKAGDAGLPAVLGKDDAAERLLGMASKVASTLGLGGEA